MSRRQRKTTRAARSMRSVLIHGSKYGQALRPVVFGFEIKQRPYWKGSGTPEARRSPIQQDMAGLKDRRSKLFGQANKQSFIWYGWRASWRITVGRNHIYTWTCWHTWKLVQAMKQGFHYQGFSIVAAIFYLYSVEITRSVTQKFSQKKRDHTEC
jgi:hypothetical protein